MNSAQQSWLLFSRRAAIGGWLFSGAGLATWAVVVGVLALVESFRGGSIDWAMHMTPAALAAFAVMLVGGAVGSPPAIVGWWLGQRLRSQVTSAQVCPDCLFPIHGRSRCTECGHSVDPKSMALRLDHVRCVLDSDRILGQIAAAAAAALIALGGVFLLARGDLDATRKWVPMMFLGLLSGSASILGLLAVIRRCRQGHVSFREYMAGPC